MKIILSEEQIKKILSTGVIDETEGEASQVAAPSNPFYAIRDASKNIDSILSTNDASYGGYETGDPMSNGSGGNWLRVVQQTYNDFKGPLFYGQYSQNYFKAYNGSTARADCTGFICAALRNAGYKVPNNNSEGMINDGSFTNQISGGFTRVDWNKNAYGTINGRPLPAGTILCYPGHGMIVGEYNPSTNKLKGYDYGNNRHDENNPENMGKIYAVAWIPKGGLNV